MDQWEEEAKNQFAATLTAEGRGNWTVLNTEVVTDPGTNENFDYQLGHEAELIALELFRLTEGELEIKRHRQWSLVTTALTKECAKRGIKGYTISTPHTFNVSTGKIDRFAVKVVDGLQKLIAANPRQDITNKGEYEIKYNRGFAVCLVLLCWPRRSVQRIW
jgi:hypothetical protein